MKNLILFLMLIAMMVLLAGCGNSNGTDKEKSQPEEMTAQQLVQRGEYLVTFVGCHDCHSPKEVGPQGPSLIKELLLSGYPADRPVMQGNPEVLKQGWILFVPDLTSASGPWGVSFSANLTSDQTGIGNWTEENFLRALKEGKYKGIANSRQLLPPMPWQNFANADNNDLRAIFAYLKSTKPVSNVVPAAIINQQPDNQVVTKK
ncbi:MAG TPA: hypothetical protein VK213_09070 [Bacteroidales bacterium]|nr:hypothetical protein [Bacteroidales bacterium]